MKHAHVTSNMVSERVGHAPRYAIAKAATLTLKAAAKHGKRVSGVRMIQRPSRGLRVWAWDDPRNFLQGAPRKAYECLFGMQSRALWRLGGMATRSGYEQRRKWDERMISLMSRASLCRGMTMLTRSKGRRPETASGYEVTCWRWNRERPEAHGNQARFASRAATPSGFFMAKRFR